jgi:hypothetical protein
LNADIVFFFSIKGCSYNIAFVKIISPKMIDSAEGDRIQISYFFIGRKQEKYKRDVILVIA